MHDTYKKTIKLIEIKDAFILISATLSNHQAPRYKIAEAQYQIKKIVSALTYLIQNGTKNNN